MMHWIRMALVLTGTVGSGLAPAADYWRPLFNGTDLAGWVPEGPGPLNGSAFAVRDGAIYGENVASQPKHGICWSDRKYSDFTVRFKYKDVRDNGGFYFRAEKDPGILTAAGIQCELDPTRDAGSLYETNGRNWVERVTQAFHDRVHKANDWNDMRVEAYGTRISVWVNGEKGASLANDVRGRMSGYFGLQTHGSLNTQHYFKGIEIMDSSYCETNAPCAPQGKVCNVVKGSQSANSCVAASVSLEPAVREPSGPRALRVRIYRINGSLPGVTGNPLPWGLNPGGIPVSTP